MRFRTYQIEAAAALAVLSGVAVVSGNRPVEWLGVAAVWVAFMHGQVTDRMTERQACAVTPDVPCWRKARAYFIGKELLWVAYFVAHRSWSALVGCGLFLAYPVWRAGYRRQG